jgi:putative ABC transport system ATP-binding protein
MFMRMCSNADTVPGVAAALFEFEDVEVERAGRTLVSGLTGSIPDHGVTVVAGPSGSGKSTLLRLCNRLEVASRGTVRHRGRDLADLDPRQLRRQVGMVFQRSTALAGTVADNLRIADPTASADALDAVLARVALDGYGDRPADTLSGGQAQRMCVARTLVTRPRAVLWDEPTSALDPATTTIIERLAVELAEQGIPSLWVTHDMSQLQRIAHHVVVVVDGRIAHAAHAERAGDTLDPFTGTLAALLCASDR